MFQWLKNLFGSKKKEENKPVEESSAVQEADIKTPQEPQESTKGAEEMSDSSDSEENNQ